MSFTIQVSEMLKLKQPSSYRFFVKFLSENFPTLHLTEYVFHALHSGKIIQYYDLAKLSVPCFSLNKKLLNNLESRDREKTRWKRGEREGG